MEAEKEMIELDAVSTYNPYEFIAGESRWSFAANSPSLFGEVEYYGVGNQLGLQMPYMLPDDCTTYRVYFDHFVLILPTCVRRSTTFSSCVYYLCSE